MMYTYDFVEEKKYFTRIWLKNDFFKCKTFLNNSIPELKTLNILIYLQTQLYHFNYLI